MSVSLVTIADDLTGAIESAVPFAGGRDGAIVAVNIDGIAQALSSGRPVLSINTASRDQSQSQACGRVEAAWHAVRGEAPAIVFKKIDSRLKGHVGAESATLARLAGRSRVIACPAVPDNGRFVEEGRVVGAGIDSPLPIAERFAGFELPLQIVDCDGPDALAALAETVVAAPATVLPVGARGFAQALAAIMAQTGHPAHIPTVSLPMLMVIGSRDAITATQIDRLREDVAQAVVIEAPGGDAGAAEPGPEDVVVLMATATPGSSDPETVAARLARAAAGWIGQGRFQTILCCGGDIAGAVCGELGIACLVPEGEVLPGIPVSTGQGVGGTFTIITKSGGFGDPDALVRIAALASAPREQAA